MSDPQSELEALPSDARCIIAFLREIGLRVRLAPLEADTFVPGICLEPGGLIVDAATLRFPGDLLHEAGHLAVMLPGERASTGANAGPDMGNEIGAQCWSYAAAVHLGLPPEIVFHEHGYKKSSGTLIPTYRDGLVGVPLLQWMGLTLDAERAAEQSQPAWPHMVRWLRQNPEEA